MDCSSGLPAHDGYHGLGSISQQDGSTSATSSGESPTRDRTTSDRLAVSVYSHTPPPSHTRSLLHPIDNCRSTWPSSASVVLIRNALTKAWLNVLARSISMNSEASKSKIGLMIDRGDTRRLHYSPPGLGIPASGDANSQRVIRFLNNNIATPEGANHSSHSHLHRLPARYQPSSKEPASNTTRSHVRARAPTGHLPAIRDRAPDPGIRHHSAGSPPDRARICRHDPQGKHDAQVRALDNPDTIGLSPLLQTQ